MCALVRHGASQQDPSSTFIWFGFFDSGFVNILNYIINFYSGVDTEVRDPRGFTALIKAGLQGREECVAALLMHGMNRWTLVQLPWRNKSILMD